MRVFLSWMLAVGCMVHAAPPAGAVKPSVALLKMEAQKGVDPGTVQVLGDHLVGTLRKTARFSRVVSGRDIEAVLDLQRQKQLLDCDTDSCMVEIAGALGVELLMLGSVGRLGSTYVVNLRLVDASSGNARGSYSETLPGAQEDALLASMERGVAAILREWSPAPITTALATEAGRGAAPGKQEGGGVSIPRVAAWGAGGVLVAVAVLGGLAGAALVAGGWGLKGFINRVPSPLGKQLLQVQVAYITAWSVGSVGLVLAVAVLVGAGALAVTGVLL